MAPREQKTIPPPKKNQDNAQNSTKKVKEMRLMKPMISSTHD